MKYFRFTEPYYALIAANSVKSALKIYEQEVSYIDDGVEFKEVDLVNQDAIDDLKQSVILFGFSYQNPKVLEEILKKYSTKEEVLLVDPALA